VASPQISPQIPPQIPPSIDDSVDEVWVFGVTLKIIFASRLTKQLSPMDISDFESIVSQSCLEYYASRQDKDKKDTTVGGGTLANRRHLQQKERRRDARDVAKANVRFVRQALSYDDNDMPLNVITYDQHFVFIPYIRSDNTPKEADQDNGDGEQDLYTPMELAELPFNETAWNMRLGNELRDNVPALKDVKLPLEVPEVPDQAQFHLSNSKVDGDRGEEQLSEGAVAGVFIAIAAVFTVIAAYVLRRIELDLQSKERRPRQNRS